MASQSSNLKKLRNGRKIVMNTVKSLHNGVLETAETLIEETVTSGVKYQKLATKAIRKSEPILDKQVDMFFDTAEAIVDQFQSGNKRFQKLLGITQTVKKAKSSLNKTVKKASNSFEKNFDFAANTIKIVANRVEDNLEKLGSTVQVSTKAVEVNTTKAKKATSKIVKTATKKAKKTVATAKKVTRKSPVKKVVAKTTRRKATARKTASTKK